MTTIYVLSILAALLFGVLIGACFMRAVWLSALQDIEDAGQ